jgi:hypothetical protein
VRDELLSVELFSSLAEAKVMVEDWREDYNKRRPHSALAMMTPASFARSWRENHRGVDDEALATLHLGTGHQLSQRVDR